MREMTRDSSTNFTSKTKQLIKSLTGNDSLTPDPSPTGEGSENQNQGGRTGDNTGGDNGGGSAGFETGN